jgi:hypothetical protein
LNLARSVYGLASLWQSAARHGLRCMCGVQKVGAQFQLRALLYVWRALAMNLKGAWEALRVGPWAQNKQLIRWCRYSGLLWMLSLFKSTCRSFGSIYFFSKIVFMQTALTPFNSSLLVYGSMASIVLIIHDVSPCSIVVAQVGCVIDIEQPKQVKTKCKVICD